MQNRVMSPHPNPASVQRISPVPMQPQRSEVTSPHSAVSPSPNQANNVGTLPPGVSNISPTPIAKENEVINQQQQQPSLAEWLHPLVEAAAQKESQIVQTTNWSYPQQTYPSYPHVPPIANNSNGHTALKVERAIQEMEKTDNKANCK